MLDPIAEYSPKQIFLNKLNKNNNEKYTIDYIITIESGRILHLDQDQKIKDIDLLIEIDFEVDRLVGFNYWIRDDDGRTLTLKAFYLLDWFSEYDKLNKEDFRKLLSAGEKKLIQNVLTFKDEPHVTHS